MEQTGVDATTKRTHIYERISGLTEDQRANAFQRASERIAGKQPDRAQYEQSTYAKYPPLMNRAINALAFSMLVFAFLPSAMRIHALALDTYNVSHLQSRYLAALCIVMMSEIGQVIFSVALAKSHTRQERWGYAFGAFACTVFALAGNAVAVGAHATQDIFAFLETFAPPVLTLITAQVLKTQMLHAIEERRTGARAYENAMRDWQSAYANASQSSSWMRTYANALRDALKDANKRSPKVVREVTNDEWRTLIMRELNADAWYEEAEERASVRESERIEQERITQQQIEEAQRIEQERKEQMRIARIATRASAIVRSGSASGTYTGETTDAVHQTADGDYAGTCPHCAETFVRDTHKGAVNALASHIGRWCKMRNAKLVHANGNGAH